MTEHDRRLDRKLRAIAAGRYTPDDFVIADAKDADMGFGLTAAGAVDGVPAGVLGPGRYQTRERYLDDMRAQANHGVVDILLTSASNGERLASDGSLPDDLTLAIRANDTSDVWVGRGAGYATMPSRPFRTVDLAAIRPFCDLVLYSITFNNDLEADLVSLEAYAAFRREAAAIGMRHFLEVFNPNAPSRLEPDEVAAFVNDSIVRALAGVTQAQRPVFLKLGYNGADALLELTEHDPSLVVGIYGGTVGHHPRHVRAAASRTSARCPRGPLRPQDPARRVPARPRRPAATGPARRAEPDRCGEDLPRGARPAGRRAASKPR